MAVNPISQRYPFELRDQSPEVVQAHRYAFQGIVDLNQAIASLKSQLDAKTVTTVTSTSTSGGGAVPAPAPFPFAGLGAVNDLTGVTVYATVAHDNGILLVFNDASPVAVSLNSALSTPYFLFIANAGTGTTTLTPSSGLINGGASMALVKGQVIWCVFDGANWLTSSIFTPPSSVGPTANEWVDSYDQVTGVFTTSQPAIGSISGLVTALGLLAPIASPTFTGAVTQPDATVLTTATTDTSATAGAATALPILPLGYLEMSVNGTTVKVPYYAV